MKNIIALILIYLSTLNVYANEQRGYINVPDEIAISCNKTVKVSSITKTVVRMTPFRGVNLIFPEKLSNDTTVYSLSSSEIWQFTKASGTRIVPLTYRTKKKVFGAIQDLTIATEDNVYSIALVAEPDIEKHCTNVVFEFSEEEKRKRDLKKRERQQLALKKDKNKNSSSLDHSPLKLVAEVATSDPDDKNIYEEKSIDFESGSLIFYIDKLKVFENFSVVLAEIKNDSSEEVRISRMNVNTNELGINKTVQGYMTPVKKLNPNDTVKVTFATTTNLKDLKRSFTVKSNVGNLNMEW